MAYMWYICAKIFTTKMWIQCLRMIFDPGKADETASYNHSKYDGWL
jgi:hypothetical protein